MLKMTLYVLLTVFSLIVAKLVIDKNNHPKGLFHLFFAEMWERFSFYGMRALLVLYIVKDYMRSVENNEEIAYGIYAAYGALVYATPLLGGVIADRLIGYRKAIMLGGVLMAVGHFFMAFPTDFFFYGALALLIAGNGFFKPNISSLVGSLYEEGDIKRDSGFTIFYMGINLGACVAPLMCGYLGESFGWHYGFGLAGIGMLAGIFVFWDGMKKGIFGEEGLQPEEYRDRKFLNFNIDKWVYLFSVIIVPVFAYLIVAEANGNHILGSLINIILLISGGYMLYLIFSYAMSGEGKISMKLGAIMILAVLCAIFWACFEQAGSSIIIWTDKVINLGGFNASETNAINPFIIIFFAIPFSVLWSKLDAIKKNPNTPIKFGLGLTLLAIGFLFFGYSIKLMGGGEQIPFFTLVIGWLFITFGELCLSPIGLSKVTQLSPKTIVAFMMGLWFLSSTVAHYISGMLAKETTKPIIELASGKDEGNFIDGLNKKMIGEENYAIYAETYNVTDSLYQELDKKFINDYNQAKIIAEILDEEGEKMFDLENALKKGGETWNPLDDEHMDLYDAELDSLNKYVAIHQKIAQLEQDTSKLSELAQLKDNLIASESIWAKKGKSGFLIAGPFVKTIERIITEIVIDSIVGDNMNTIYAVERTTQDSLIMIPPSEREIFISDEQGNIAMKKNEDGKEVTKTYDLTSFQQNYLESNFRYKKGYFEEGSEVFERSQFATFISMRYNNLYGKIGFMTLLIAIGTFICSPIIKKLMGDVH